MLCEASITSWYLKKIYFSSCLSSTLERKLNDSEGFVLFTTNSYTFRAVPGTEQEFNNYWLNEWVNLLLFILNISPLPVKRTVKTHVLKDLEVNVNYERKYYLNGSPAL